MKRPGAPVLLLLALLPSCGTPSLFGNAWSCQSDEDCLPGHTCIDYDPADGSGSACRTVIIVDNDDPRLFQVVQGTWEVADCIAHQIQDCHGDSFHYADGSCMNCQAVFAPVIEESGVYDVTMWWPSEDDRSTATPVTVNHSGGEPSQLVLDQRNTGSSWYPLGTYQFIRGEVASVVVHGHANGEEWTYVNADAVRFVHLQEEDQD
jgi:hypothetical protein